MLAKSLAAFFAALIVTVASSLTFEEKPAVEQFSAPPPPATALSVPVSQTAVVAMPVPPPMRAMPRPQKRAPRVALALAPVRVVENTTPQPHVAELASGTNLFVQLGERLSPRDNYAGETFRGTLEAPIIWKDFIIAERGSKVLGRIVTTEKQHLTLTLTEISTTDGQQVAIRTNVLGSGPRLAFQLSDPLTLTEKLNR